MKRLITMCAMLFSFQAFSQSYLVLNNGIALTLDKAGFVYDFGHTILPYKVSGNGGQFLISDKKLFTVDFAGFFYEKDLVVEKIRAKGYNYFIDDKNNLVTITETGFYNKFDKDVAFLKKAKKFGGNFFTVEEKKTTDLYTINFLGNYFKTVVPGLNPKDIKVFGGRFFQSENGTLYTVSKEGFVYPKPEIKVQKIKTFGGNFLIDSTNTVFTITDTGELILASVPATFNAANIEKVGANYMLDKEARLFAVDGLGTILERKVNHDLRISKVLSF